MSSDPSVRQIQPNSAWASAPSDGTTKNGWL